MNAPDSPIPLVLSPVVFRDGKLAGTEVMVDQEKHHWLAPGEYYERINFAPPGGPRNLLRSEFVLVREGYRAVKSLNA